MHAAAGTFFDCAAAHAWKHRGKQAVFNMHEKYRMSLKTGVVLFFYVKLRKRCIRTKSKF